MRPTVIRLIAGGALGVAFSISLTLPGSVVFPDEAPIRQLAAPKAPARKVVRAARMVERPAPPKPRVVVQRVYVPTPAPVRTTTVVRQAPLRPAPSRKHAKHAPARVEQPVTPLAAPKAPPVAAPADEDGQGEDEARTADREGKPEKPKRATKSNHGWARKDKHEGARDEDRADRRDGHGRHEKGGHGHGRGGHGDHG